MESPTTNSVAARTFGAALALVAWFGVILQAWLTLRSTLLHGGSVMQGVGVFLSFFTVLTNLLVAIAVTVPLLAGTAAAGRFFARADLRAAVATSIAFVGISYYVLLRKIWNPQGAQLLADVILHYAVPALSVIFWWRCLPKQGLRWPQPLVWSLYPVLYFVCVLARGLLTGTYPYFFLDAGAIGYAQTWRNAFGLLFVFIFFGWIFVAIGRAHESRRRSAAVAR
jgi:hypothetical protein